VPAEASSALGAPDNWVAPLARALPALVLGLLITFSQDHSSILGLISFGVFAVVTAAILLASALRADPGLRGTVLLQGIFTGIAGIAALVLPGGGIGYLVYVVSGWAIVAGAIETVNGIRYRKARLAARDWLLTGVLTLLLGLAFLLVPQGLAEGYGFEEKGEEVSGVITADIVLVGILGAWAIVVGVQLVIAAITLRTPRNAPTEVTA
jgi:uncharacterized membrane protein HdeD (DUF308 family)